MELKPYDFKKPADAARICMCPSCGYSGGGGVLSHLVIRSNGKEEQGFRCNECDAYFPIDIGIYNSTPEHPMSDGIECFLKKRGMDWWAAEVFYYDPPLPLKLKKWDLKDFPPTVCVDLCLDCWPGPVTKGCAALCHIVIRENGKEEEGLWCNSCDSYYPKDPGVRKPTVERPADKKIAAFLEEKGMDWSKAEIFYYEP